jgi:hypothetical protein
LNPLRNRRACDDFRISVDKEEAIVDQYSCSHITLGIPDGEITSKIDQHLQKWASNGWKLITVLHRTAGGRVYQSIEYTCFWQKSSIGEYQGV